MDYEADDCKVSVWQATLPSMADNFAVEWQKSANSSERSCQRTSKKLTTEAIFVLCVIIFFIVMSVISSSLNAYESLRKYFLRKKTSKDQKKERNRMMQVKSESSNIPVWRRNGRKILDCFCIQANVKKILFDVPKNENLSFIDGIRVLIFFGVYVGHFFFFLGRSIKNPEKHIHALLVMPFAVKLSEMATFGMDPFIILSGFLNGYFFSNYFEKNKGKIPWISFYAVRILRLTPVYLIILGFYATLFTYMSSSPIWPTYDTNPVCKETWIWNVLYINNFKSMSNQCFCMSWFLACLMQLYFISPLFMIPLNRWPRVGYVLFAITICISSFLRYLVTKQYNLSSSLPPPGTGLVEFNERIWLFMDVLHQKAYLRFTPYLIGILIGYYLHRRRPTKNHWLTLFLGWTTSSLLMHIFAFAPPNKEELFWQLAIYNGVKDLLFSLGFSWLIYACATGQGGSFGKFLSYKIFKPISRISFCGYLTEAIVLEGYFLSVEVFMDASVVYNGILSNLSWVPIMIRLFSWILASAFVVSLLFESPVMRLLQISFNDKKKNL